MIFHLGSDLHFPDPSLLDSPGGLIAVGGDLSPERIMLAYENGIFPWSNEDEELLWWCPDPRFVLFPENLRVSHSMRKILQNNIFTITQNQCFEDVMRNCRTVKRKDQDGTWISEELISSFVELYKKGIAKSVEVWKDNILVGGFYGLEMGDVFCGESMFSKVSNASKAGFITFIDQSNYKLIDCQIYSKHLQSLGAENISKKDFLKILKKNE